MLLEDLYVDIGAESREEAEKKVSVGDAAVYMGQPVQTGTTLFSPYLDDRLGCVILLKTMELAADSPNDLYFVFTVQEEVGLCGAHTAAHGIVPDYGIAVDVTCTDDVPGSRHTVSAALGKGAGIKVMDGLPDVPWSCGGAAYGAGCRAWDSGPAGSHVRWRDGCRSHAYFP